MNRRELINHSTKALLGIGGIMIGVKAAESDPIDLTRSRKSQEIHVFVTPGSDRAFQDAVARTVVNDVRANGRIREVIMNVL